jgi:hypothetical protein
LEREDGRLRKAVAGPTLERLVPKGAASGSVWALPLVGPLSRM